MNLREDIINLSEAMQGNPNWSKALTNLKNKGITGKITGGKIIIKKNGKVYEMNKSLNNIPEDLASDKLDIITVFANRNNGRVGPKHDENFTVRTNLRLLGKALKEESLEESEVTEWDYNGKPKAIRYSPEDNRKHEERMNNKTFVGDIRRKYKETLINEMNFVKNRAEEILSKYLKIPKKTFSVSFDPSFDKILTDMCLGQIFPKTIPIHISVSSGDKNGWTIKLVKVPNSIKYKIDRNKWDNDYRNLKYYYTEKYPSAAIKSYARKNGFNTYNITKNNFSNMEQELTNAISSAVFKIGKKIVKDKNGQFLREKNRQNKKESTTSKRLVYENCENTLNEEFKFFNY